MSGKTNEDGEGGTATLTRTKKKVARPKMYRVLLHNDDYTTMEFVVAVLIMVFHHNEVSATRVMLHVHHNGAGVAGVYTREIADAKVAKVAELAHEAGFPLLCTMEPESDGEGDEEGGDGGAAGGGAG